MIEDAPPRLSIRTVCFRLPAIASPTARALESALPPAGYGTTTRIGALVGHSCAHAGCVSARAAREHRVRRLIMLSPGGGREGLPGVIAAANRRRVAVSARQSTPRTLCTECTATPCKHPCPKIPLTGKFVASP